MVMIRRKESRGTPSTQFCITWTPGKNLGRICFLHVKVTLENIVKALHISDMGQGKIFVFCITFNNFLHYKSESIIYKYFFFTIKTRY